jgi:hypothetical protein
MTSFLGASDPRRRSSPAAMRARPDGIVSRGDLGTRQALEGRTLEDPAVIGPARRAARTRGSGLAAERHRRAARPVFPALRETQPISQVEVLERIRCPTRYERDRARSKVSRCAAPRTRHGDSAWRLRTIGMASPAGPGSGARTTTRAHRDHRRIAATSAASTSASHRLGPSVASAHPKGFIRLCSHMLALDWRAR